MLTDPSEVYQEMHTYLRECGVDGVKVDCQVRACVLSDSSLTVGQGRGQQQGCVCVLFENFLTAGQGRGQRQGWPYMALQDRGLDCWDAQPFLTLCSLLPHAPQPAALTTPALSRALTLTLLILNPWNECPSAST